MPVRRLFQSHAELPVALRVWVVVPATIALVIIGGMGFTLPPGPLCDEGMVLFMEGGCDWGDSNIFFFSKLGLLLALNLVFIIGWRARLRRMSGFIPHLLVLALLAVVERSGGHCDSYYSHPNGSIGQMVLECIAFALLGMSLLAVSEKRPWGDLLAILAAWNALYVGTFYAWLPLTNHWTWLHSILIFGTLVTLAMLIALASRPYPKRP
ncbi:MAG: hypothetical protein JWN02_1954 [Acidobacteria bacterium]|nr:hypothetical protein [Acidobacteriota bacterium]